MTKWILYTLNWSNELDISLKILLWKKLEAVLILLFHPCCLWRPAVGTVTHSIFLFFDSSCLALLLFQIFFPMGCPWDGLFYSTPAFRGTALFSDPHLFCISSLGKLINLFVICAAVAVHFLITDLSPFIYTHLSYSRLHVPLAEVCLPSLHMKATTVHLCPNPPFWITKPLWPFICDASKSCGRFLQCLAKLHHFPATFAMLTQAFHPHLIHHCALAVFILFA